MPRHASPATRGTHPRPPTENAMPEGHNANPQVLRLGASNPRAMSPDDGATQHAGSSLQRSAGAGQSSTTIQRPAVRQLIAPQPFDETQRQVHEQTQQRQAVSSARPETRRSLREEFHSRSKQLITSQPRLVSAVYLDTQWTQALGSSPMHVLLNPQRWACTRCAIVQQAFAIDAANRIQWKRSGDEFFVHQGPPDVVHDQSIDGSTSGESCCCGWTLVPQGGNSMVSSSTSSGPTMRAFGCEWSAHAALVCVVLTDILTLGLPCSPIGYLGCGSLWVGLQTRLLIRRKYRILGFGIHDWCTVACCPQCAVEQQMNEMIRQGVLLTSPSPCEMC
jgi:Cys-rich protein (TIGR01571 family)